MKLDLFKVYGKRLVHKSVPLPPIINQYVCATGREGPACGADFGVLYLVEKFKGEAGDITCKKCRALA
jgi:hypothetical protein